MTVERRSRRMVSNTGEYTQSAGAVSNRNKAMDGCGVQQKWKQVEKRMDRGDGQMDREHGSMEGRASQGPVLLVVVAALL